MYVITFYSFKGGVGRTMALVNVAAELVRRGRKVVVVDFDLEAPGLETYKHLQPPKPHPGIVEFVTEYIKTHHAPSVVDYMYETQPIGKNGGRLWVMPAGRRDGDYRRALANLNWQRLYQQQKGFLLFEDAKLGWQEELKPDYVLIDSRTGDTDVLGICTRQLPDSVAVVFTPNAQNLEGLENVCRDIRREEKEGLKKDIRLQFVAANMPDLDDESGVLRRQMKEFCERLDFRDKDCSRIRRYESLNLLDQSVFVLDRRNSRLAREYRQLAKDLTKFNLVDPDSARRYLKRSGKELFEYHRADRESVLGCLLLRRALIDVRRAEANAITKIIEHFLDDPDMLFRAAKRVREERDCQWALRLLDFVLKIKPDFTEALFERALCKKSIPEEKEGAVHDLLQYIGTPGIDDANLYRAFSELHAVAPDRIVEAYRPHAKHVEKRKLIDDVCLYLLPDTEEGAAAAAELATWDLHYRIMARQWKQTIELAETEIELTKTVSSPDLALSDFIVPAETGIELAKARELTKAQYYLAIAYWGVTGVFSQERCRDILDLLYEIQDVQNQEKEEQEEDSAGWDRNVLLGYIALGEHQGDDRDAIGTDTSALLSLVLWGAGEVQDAITELDSGMKRAEAARARYLEKTKAKWDLFSSHQESWFSPWRYRRVTVDQFFEDCRLLRRMYQGEPLRPAFLGPPTAAMQVLGDSAPASRTSL